MKQIELATWEDFEANLHALEARLEGIRRTSGLPVSKLLFRGHADATWRLETTLERYAPRVKAAEWYYHLMYFNARPTIEAFTGIASQLVHPKDYLQWLQSDEAFQSFAEFPGVPFMVYLRHHGFPSPLLDWSRSPYVAAFFAFRDVTSRATSVSIYASLDYVGTKAKPTERPRIVAQGRYATAHRRHFIQQCEYTVCCKYREWPRENMPPGKAWEYAGHEDVVASDNAAQDLLWKFNLPASERLKVLRAIDRYNINARSLFETDESLMETVALRALLLEPADLIPEPPKADSPRRDS
jgi:hypothetical protein